MYRDIPEELRALIEPVVEDGGFELVDVKITRGRPPWLLRVTVDTPEGDGRVSVEDCARVSREIETNLDASDAIASSYRLEVSSPGLDRQLAREKDFTAACGSHVKIETRAPIDGRRRFRGVLREFRSGIVTVEIDGREIDIPFEQVTKANTVYKFTRDDFTSGVDSGSEPR